jgi:hypothetical protein
MSVASDVADLVIAQLRVRDDAPGAYCLVGESIDTKHPCGFNGHNASLCKVPSLLVTLRRVDGRDAYVFHRLDLGSEAHRERRARGEAPRWKEESTVLLDREGAAAELYMRARSNKDELRVCRAAMAQELRLEDGSLGGSRYIGTEGSVPVDTLEAALHAVALLGARSVKGL